jgi:hypothetical protein
MGSSIATHSTPVRCLDREPPGAPALVESGDRTEPVKYVNSLFIATRQLSLVSR